MPALQISRPHPLAGRAPARRKTTTGAVHDQRLDTTDVRCCRRWATRLAWACTAAVLLAVDSATAAPTGTTVDWVTPYAMARPEEHVELWLRLSVADTASEPLVLDGTAANFDLTTDLPGWSSVTWVEPQPWIVCMSDFVPSGCDDPAAPYRFDFNDGPDAFGIRSAGGIRPGFTLEPGEHRDFLIGSFVPQHGPVAPGVYTMRYAGLQLWLDGFDLAGNPIRDTFGLGWTCHGDCAAFTREVLAVPEPASAALVMLGSVGLWAVGRRLRDADRHRAAAPSSSTVGPGCD